MDLLPFWKTLAWTGSVHPGSSLQMGCVQSKPGGELIESESSTKDITKITIYATAGEASEAEQQRVSDNGFKAPFRRISNKIIPVLDYLAHRTTNQTSVVPFSQSHGDAGGVSGGNPGLAYLRYCPTAPRRWKKGEAIGSGSFGNVFVGLNLDTGEHTYWVVIMLVHRKLAEICSTSMIVHLGGAAMITLAGTGAGMLSMAIDKPVLLRCTCTNQSALGTKTVQYPLIQASS